MPQQILKPSRLLPRLPGRKPATTADAPRTDAAQGSAAESLARHLGAVDWEALEPRGLYARYGRRLLDLGVLLAVSPFALPIGLAIAFANAIASRSLRDAFFVQERIGYRGRPFRIIKFRTMSPAPESEMDSWSSGGDQMRVTPFGRLLRNTHLDELPQLINVLRGEMHLIGPRPEMLEVEAWACDNIPGFSERLAIRPGITGYAQITQGYTGRDVGEYSRKLELCLRYQHRISLRTDISIVVLTVLWMVRGRGWKWCESALEADEQPAT